jgi:hypothetical protein
MRTMRRDSRTASSPTVALARFVRIAACVGALLSATPVLGTESTTLFFTSDVPTNLSAVDYTPNQIVRLGGGVYSLALAMPAEAEIAALHKRTDGSWIFSPASAVTLGGVDYEARDVVSYNGTSFAMVFDGSSAGVPPDARIDALWMNAGGDLVMSFDVPATVGTVQTTPGDLVIYAGGSFSLLWDAESAGVPSSTNLTGAHEDAAGNVIMSLDVPTNLMGNEFLPGSLVSWDGSGFSTYSTNPGWPAGSDVRDFSLSVCGNTACAGECWADGTVPNEGTTAVQKAFAPVECGLHAKGCITRTCD